MVDLLSLSGVHVAMCRTARLAIRVKYMVNDNQTATKSLLCSTIVDVCSVDVRTPLSKLNTTCPFCMEGFWGNVRHSPT